MTEFPNFFRHKTQAEASLEVQQFSPLVQINCSPDLAFFLCTLYTPICTSLDKPPLPCRELCVRVREGCLPLLLKFNFKWPEAMNCEQFSRRGDSICIDRPDVATVATPSPSPSPSPVIQPQGEKDWDLFKLCFRQNGCLANVFVWLVVYLRKWIKGGGEYIWNGRKGMYSRGILFSLLVGVCCQRIGRNIPQNQRGQKTVLPFRFWPLTVHCIFYLLVPSV